MAKITVEQFIDLVKKSGLVDDQRLNETLGELDLSSVKDAGVVASCLTKKGLLSEWQSEKLMQGKHKGFHLGKYKLLNHIGTGGMGAVYLAEHMVMRHRVAIKLLPNHLAAHTSYLERFHQEARASARLHHPNMVRAMDVDQEDNLHYLVMDFVDGTDLQAVVSRTGPLPYRTAADYTRQAAEGLAYAHQMGLIHRDIKPANLLVDKLGVVKILDMGLARFTDETQGSLTREYDQKMIGTVDYLAPEQAIDSHKVDLRVDIYSLGCTLYFMLTGDAPFPQGTIPQRLMMHQSAEPSDIRKVRADAPEELIAICKKMMAKAAGDRYQTADEVAQALSDWLGDRDPPIGSDEYGGNSSAPAGPSLNEILKLAPLDDEPGSSRVTATRAVDPKGSGVGSKSGARSGSGVGAKTDSHSVTADETAVDKPGVKKPKSGVKQAPPTAPPSKPPDLMDDLLTAPPPAPSTSAPMPSTASSPGRRHHHSHHPGQTFPMWLTVTLGVVAALVLVGIILGGLLYWDSISRY
jgi:eukaryotic-like serine/threonine-protein kinase